MKIQRAGSLLDEGAVISGTLLLGSVTALHLSKFLFKPI